MSGPPQDDAAERALLGGMLVNPARIGDVADTVGAGDFYRPTHGHIFAAMVALWKSGDSPDLLAVAGSLAASGVAVDDRLFVDLVSEAGVAWRAHADRVVALSSARRVLHAAHECIGRIDAGEDPYTVCDDTVGAMRAVEMPGRRPVDVWSIDQFLERPESERPPWVIKGQLRAGWRVMVVAGEGSGKSLLLRQAAVAAAQGLNPFTFEANPKCRTLIVDLENPVEAITELGGRLVDAARGRKGDAYERDRAWIWHRPSGIDLRSRTDRGAFEAVLADIKPHLVCIGPMYKMYRAQANEPMDLVAGEVQSALDKFRERFGFALMIEHHAPKKQGSGERDIEPFGSSLWLRWPEFGLKLVAIKEEPGALDVRRFRGDRLEATWPDRLVRGKTWPWECRWPTGTFTNPERDEERF